jgi:hypothetical protein
MLVFLASQVFVQVVKQESLLDFDFLCGRIKFGLKDQISVGLKLTRYIYMFSVSLPISLRVFDFGIQIPPLLHSHYSQCFFSLHRGL